MKLDDIEKALSLKKSLTGLRGDLKKVSDWMPGGIATYVTVEGFSILLTKPDAGLRLKRVIVGIVEDHLDEVTAQLRGLGVEIDDSPAPVDEGRCPTCDVRRDGSGGHRDAVPWDRCTTQTMSNAQEGRAMTFRHADRSMSYDYARERERWRRRSAIKRLSLWLLLSFIFAIIGGDIMHDATTKPGILTALFLMFCAAGTLAMAVVEVIDMKED